MLCVFAAMANAQPIPKSVYKTPTPKPVKITQKIVVRDRPVYIVKNNDRDGDGLTDAIDECPDEKGSPKNNGCPEKTVSIPFPEMIVVAGGSFMMGGTEKDEKPSHHVALSGFSMAKTKPRWHSGGFIATHLARQCEKRHLGDGKTMTPL